MAFIKSPNFAYEQNKNLTIASGAVNGIISLPLVVTKEDGKYHGFVPGIVMKDFVCDTTTECETKLKVFVKDYILEMRKTQKPYPFFPTNEEIKKDFKGVVLIKRLMVRTK